MVQRVRRRDRKARQAADEKLFAPEAVLARLEKRDQERQKQSQEFQALVDRVNTLIEESKDK